MNCVTGKDLGELRNCYQFRGLFEISTPPLGMIGNDKLKRFEITKSLPLLGQVATTDEEIREISFSVIPRWHAFYKFTVGHGT